MIIEIVSHDSRAPSVAAQKQAIRSDGTQPEKTLDFPDDLDILSLALRDDENDIVTIASPKVFGSAHKARGILFALARMNARIKVAGGDPFSVNTEAEQTAFLALLAVTPWGQASAKQRRNRGRPTELKQPTASQKDTYCIMWRDPKKFTRNNIRDLAREELKREVEDWEFKHWCGPKRSQP